MATYDSQGRLLKRRETNFFGKADVTTTSFGDCVITWGFNSHGFSLMVESYNIMDAVEYSFDGQTVHGDLTPTLPSSAVVFDNRVQNTIWFRLKSIGDPVVVRIEAWRNDT